MARHVVAHVDEVPEGRPKQVEVQGRKIGLYNLRGEFFALLDRCPHEGASLCKGRLIGLAESDTPGSYRLTRQGEMLRCPWHGWEFDIRTGQSFCDPTHMFVRRYAVTVEPGQNVVKGPYVAESFPVSLEENYLVLEL